MANYTHKAQHNPPKNNQEKLSYNFMIYAQVCPQIVVTSTPVAQKFQGRVKK